MTASAETVLDAFLGLVSERGFAEVTLRDVAAAADIGLADLYRLYRDKVALAAAFMARRVVRPLSELTTAAAAMAAGSGRPHVAEQGPEDVRNAAAAFNTMAEKVARTLESQRHLLSAVGHDLRTPLTAMRINLEFIEDEELRQGIKVYSDWPTIPQLYVKGEFIGGSDIVKEMFQSGELKTAFAEKGLLTA